MHSITHSLAQRAPPAARTRARWQPYNSLISSSSSSSSISTSSSSSSSSSSSTSSTSSSSISRSPSNSNSTSYLNTPASSVTSSSPSPPCDPRLVQPSIPPPQTPKDPPQIQSRDPHKTKYALGLVDQAVKSLCEIWHPQDIPTVFLVAAASATAARLPVPGQSTGVNPSTLTTSTSTSTSTKGVTNPKQKHQHQQHQHQKQREQRELQHRRNININTQLPSPVSPSTQLSPSSDSDSPPFAPTASNQRQAQGQGQGQGLSSSSTPTPPTAPQGSSSTTPSTPSPSPNTTEYTNTTPPTLPPLKSFVHEVLRRSRTSATVLPSPLLCPRRAFLASLILASKFTQDRCYSNRAWAKLSGLPAREVGRCERALGGALEWRLWVGKGMVPMGQVQMGVATGGGMGTGMGTGRSLVRTSSDGALIRSAAPVVLPVQRKPFVYSSVPISIPTTNHLNNLNNTNNIDNNDNSSNNNFPASAPSGHGRGLRRCSTLPADAYAYSQSQTQFESQSQSSQSQATTADAYAYAYSQFESQSQSNIAYAHPQPTPAYCVQPETPFSAQQMMAPVHSVQMLCDTQTQSRLGGYGMTGVMHQHHQQVYSMCANNTITNNNNDPSPNTPALSPSTTESSSDTDSGSGGDRTIQMSTFLDEGYMFASSASSFSSFSSSSSYANIGMGSGAFGMDSDLNSNATFVVSPPGSNLSNSSFNHSISNANSNTNSNANSGVNNIIDGSYGPSSKTRTSTAIYANSHPHPETSQYSSGGYAYQPNLGPDMDAMQMRWNEAQLPLGAGDSNANDVYVY